MNSNIEEKFYIYELETKKSFLERLAVQLNTLPKYLYFPNGFPTLEKNLNLQVENILDIIKTNANQLDFIKLYNNISGKIEGMNLKLEEDILVPFVIYNKSIFQTDKDYRNTILLVVQSMIDKSDLFLKLPNIENIWDRRYEYLKIFESNLERNFQSSKKSVDTLEKYEKIKEGIQYTKFEIQKVDFNFEILYNDVSIMDMFNDLNLNIYTPFACVNNFYKILQDFIPPETWSVNLDNAIIIKILQKTVPVNIKVSDYTDILVGINGDIGEEKMIVNMSLESNSKYLNRKKIIERFLNTLEKITIKNVKNIKENKINGVFYFPLQNFNNFVFSDLVMNNKLFSSLMSIDESEKSTKSKDSIYIYFNDDKIGSVTANITEKFSQKGDINLKNKNIDKEFKYGSNYIRIKITQANNIQAVEIFQKILSKLFKIYNEEYEDIVSFYRNFIPNFAKDKKVKPIVTKNLKLKDIEPMVFVKGYPPKCPHQPSIIEDYEIKEAEREGKQVMKYPISEDEGFMPRNYICNHEKAKYPGLRSNPLSNNEIVPYLPCCYEKNHFTKKGSIFRHYFYQEDLKEKTIGQQDIIKTKKFVEKDNFGTLPNTILNLFYLYDSKKYSYNRKGVLDSKSSFLECVLEGLYQENDILNKKNDKQRLNYVLEKRKELSLNNIPNLAKQSMYDFTFEEIVKIIKDPDIYLDPKFFTQLLEEYFNCNIYVFTKNKANIKLLVPRYLQGYYRNKRRVKCIYIYQHTGSKSDHGNYPRCELIVRWDKKNIDNINYYLTYNSNISLGIRKLFNNMIKTYIVDLNLEETSFPLTNIKFITQKIDSYGKCRMLNIEYESKIYTLITSPISPKNLPNNKNWDIFKMNIDVALKFCSELGITITGQNIQNGSLIELYCFVGNVKIFIPISETIPISGVPKIKKSLNYPLIGNSVINSYISYKKLSHCITEYIFWLYSRFLQSKNINDNFEENFSKTISEFVTKNVEINNYFIYSKIKKNFSINSSLINNKKIIIKSKETLKRLLYVLHLNIVQNSTKIKNYYKHKSIQNYYQNLTDFDKKQFQVILKGENSIQKWIYEKKVQYNLYYKIQQNLLVPYFFYNSLINNRIYLAQNTDSMLKAINIGKTWSIQKYNIGDDAEELEQLSFNLYSYKNATDILLYSVKGISNSYNINIVGYKIDENSFYTVLLLL